MKKETLGAGDRIWLHRQNIARYKALMAGRIRRDDHDQIERLLAEEEEKLRALGQG